MFITRLWVLQSKLEMTMHTHTQNDKKWQQQPQTAISTERALSEVRIYLLKCEDCVIKHKKQCFRFFSDKKAMTSGH